MNEKDIRYRSLCTLRTYSSQQIIFESRGKNYARWRNNAQFSWDIPESKKSKSSYINKIDTAVFKTP